ncbi:hypothetical protein Nepgr_031968 [Nepenthes gracilis]|uniref:Late embryogenesis abundant protein LEA-2 subgroup domain-containing protein n=1 Tax=Nepenthes gracilis TaxID=150966 RepID=A0AAD3THQ3_NEPGR|nr:hypothetical protein Nepgr_031968 [Nepenthes gracilis]
MSQDKQTYLNRAYYGPPIPPPAKTYRRPSHGGGCRCCLLDCLCDCGCCLLSCVFKIVCSILIFIGLIALSFWLLLRPHEVKFYAVDASLAQFNFSVAAGGDTLYYDLAVNLTVRNPNRHIGIYYDEIAAGAYYEDQRFGMAALSPFYQGHENTTSLETVTFKGQNVLILSSSQSSDYGGQKKDGVFDIAVKLFVKMRIKVGWVKIGKFKPKIECDLKVPLSSSGKRFEFTKCRYDF